MGSNHCVLGILVLLMVPITNFGAIVFFFIDPVDLGGWNGAYSDFGIALMFLVVVFMGSMLVAPTVIVAVFIMIMVLML